jgi:hypothetical protein
VPQPVVLRADLDFSPWDDRTRTTPAGWLRLAELARNRGWVVHAFATARCVTALPTIVEAVLGEGHELDWWCPGPALATAWTEALSFVRGVALDRPGLGKLPSQIEFSVGAESSATVQFDGNEAVRWAASDLETDPELVTLESAVADALAAGRILTTYRRLVGPGQP